MRPRPLLPPPPALSPAGAVPLVADAAPFARLQAPFAPARLSDEEGAPQDRYQPGLADAPAMRCRALAGRQAGRPGNGARWAEASHGGPEGGGARMRARGRRMHSGAAVTKSPGRRIGQPGGVIAPITRVRATKMANHRLRRHERGVAGQQRHRPATPWPAPSGPAAMPPARTGT